MRALVTGAGGFVGRETVLRLASQPGCEVIGGYRNTPPPQAERVTPLALADFAEGQSLNALPPIDAVVHLAARAHIMNDTATDPLAEFRRVNVEGSRQVALAAAAAGARRFVFVSSIKVHGERTMSGRPFRADDLAAPVDPYGVSKLEAELALRETCISNGLELVIVRPPLVYGPGVRANFRSMMKWLSRGVPLPFGAVNNLRSLVALDNLCDLLVTCTRHPAAAGQTFLVSDGEDVSTTGLLQRLGLALEHRARLVPVPAGVLQALLGAIGKADVAQRLFSSLQVDISPTCNRLGWKPPISLDEGLRRAATAFLADAGN